MMAVLLPDKMAVEKAREEAANVSRWERNVNLKGRRDGTIVIFCGVYVSFMNVSRGKDDALPRAYLKIILRSPMLSLVNTRVETLEPI